jgi:hypothetical protein
MSYNAPQHPLRIFAVSIIVALAAIALGGLYGGIQTALLVALLVVFEVSLSADNAIVNARIVEKMSHFWRVLFLTVGIFVAVILMRLLFPIVIVAITTGLNPLEAFNLAMEKGDPETPGTYGFILNEAHPQIAAFGGMFLLMLFLYFIFEEREIKWLKWLEVPLAKIGKLDVAPIVVGVVALLVIATIAPHHAETVLVSGLSGMLVFLVINSVGNLFEAKLDSDEENHTGVAGATVLVGKAGFVAFLYLEVLDASFSFDGVIGAFAITTDPIVIALGLGAGALFVRSITIYLVNKGTLNEYVYLDHGAHWAIGVLAGLLITSIAIHVPEVVTGLIGVGLIIAALISSVVYNKRNKAIDDGSQLPVNTTVK